MKKLMFAAVAALACTAFAEEAAPVAEIPSENIVGYQYIQIPTGYSLYTATFKNISGDTIDLRDIRVFQQDGSEFETGGKSKVCKGAVTIQKIKDNGIYDTVYFYYSTLNGGCWAINSTTPADKPITLKPGEGFAICNDYAPTTKDPKEPVTLRVSGEVDLVCKNLVATGYSIMGNSTPVDIDLRDIKVCQQDGTPFETGGKSKVCKGAVTIQKIKDNGIYDTVYFYYSTLNGGCWAINSTTPAPGKIELKAGESFAICNDYAPTTKDPKEPVMLILPNPLGETAE